MVPVVALPFCCVILGVVSGELQAVQSRSEQLEGMFGLILDLGVECEARGPPGYARRLFEIAVGKRTKRSQKQGMQKRHPLLSCSESELSEEETVCSRSSCGSDVGWSKQEHVEDALTSGASSPCASSSPRAAPQVQRYSIPFMMSLRYSCMVYNGVICQDVREVTSEPEPRSKNLSQHPQEPSSRTSPLSQRRNGNSEQCEQALQAHA
eukprot:44955-Rhodomonas_salina.1